METSLATRTNGHAAPAVDSQVVVITKDSDLSWMLIPQLRDRIRAFCINYDTRATPETLLQRLAEHFVAEKPGMYMLALINDGLVVGHVLAALESYHDKIILSVIQYEIDEGAKVEPGQLKAGFERMKMWAKKNGASIIDVQPVTDVWERGLRVFYGFKPYRKIMTMEI